ncbi:dicarboxylate/amino acid:cation symporter [Dermatophilus congolensis]|uniref:dicarboxylate/amino acid:cation symporter n=1 Tax=Dermatophilus congolensis TaxID=1863 RepID=UPI001AAEB9AC|nr:dicarboxylate/amino acid:cation symporter [Dermatophilus congolensis]MBO3141921.1 dicarboxylate/amino acid:cation symporter [Dermatophilus congolensis]MBO3150915.1 dicarboxylate/amino acid:cation symporter [Dermatophilus congolensis]MBO3162080.1 dicarboxylate/amino acid:cation symporter [Dermatophilus congolensis]MBO3162195.1 dicarboxylate/amino acid:cation symporter [Dermatophilus congolensis]MBO3175751.1 dicarboxylate/amino acid:cation symporter [Dermatophilus congolensis]
MSTETAPPKRHILPSYTVQVLLALVLGVVLGLIARTANITWLAATLDITGTLFVQLLKLTIPILVFTAVVSSIAHLRGVTGAARLAGQTLLWFAATGLAASLTGLAVGLITNPGRGVTLDMSAAHAPKNTGSWLDFITGIIPTNVVGAFVENNVLQIVFIAAVIGVATIKVGDAAQPFLDLVDSLLEIVQKALWWVILLAPIGTLGLIGRAVAQYGWDLIGPLATFTADIYIGCLVVLAILYPLFLRLGAGLSVRKFYAAAWPAIQLGFVSRSSVGTMPLTQRVTIERLGVDRGYAAFAIPFGATSKMDGCAAVYPAIAAIFVAQIFGVDLTLAQYALIVFVSVIGSAATAGLNGATVMLTLTLSTIGLPLEGVGLLLAVDPIIDMIRTATNVTGQAAITAVVAAREKLLDHDTYQAANTDLNETTPSHTENTETTPTHNENITMAHS